MDPRFAHIRDWIFDLDNCLYPASTGLFALIDERMGAYIQRLLDCDPDEAKRVQKAHFHEHGTTLAGLMKEHGVDPHDFLEDVHAIPLDRVQCDERLGRLLPRLPGPALRLHQRRCALCAPGAGEDRSAAAISTSCTTSTPAISGPSPIRTAIELLCERFGIDPKHALLVDDMVQNLAPAKALGMTTVWVDNGSERGNHGYDEAVVDHRISNVGEWLESILGDSE